MLSFGRSVIRCCALGPGRAAGCHGRARVSIPLVWSGGHCEAGHDGIAMATVHRAIGIASAELVHHVLGTEDQGVVDAHSTRYDSMRDQVVAFPRTAQLLTACAERGLGVVLATSGAPADLSWMRPAIGAEDAVLGVTTSGDVESAKPAPDLLTTAVHAHHLDPAGVVVVGDTVWDIEAARAAGLPCIALTCGGIPAPVLLEAGAVAGYADPAELLERLADSPIGRIPVPHG